MDLRAVAYATGVDYPGGIDALAACMGMKPADLRAMLDPRNKLHPLSLHDSVALQFISGDHRILHAMAEELGYECVPARASA